MNGMKLYMALAVWMFAAPAWATCGVGGYWGSECGPQTPDPAGDITNTATGGAASSDATAGAIGVGIGGGATVGDLTATGTGYGGAGGQGGVGHGGAGGSVGDTTATSGSASTATGGSVTGSGNSTSTSTATGGAGGRATAGVSGSGNSRSTSGVTGSGNSNSRNVNNIDASTSSIYREAANTVIAPPLVGNGPQNCYGDTNPSGSTSAGIGTREFQAVIGHAKPMNPCGVVWAEERAYQGRPVLMHYYSANDPAANRAFKQAGMTGKPGDGARRQAAWDQGPGYTLCTPEKIRVVPGREDEGVANCQAALAADRRAPKNAPRAVQPTPAVQAYAQASAYRSCYLVGNVAEVDPKTPDAKAACAAKYPSAFKVR